MVKSKLKLHGFNNLTKTLSFNIYDIMTVLLIDSCYNLSSLGAVKHSMYFMSIMIRILHPNNWFHRKVIHVKTTDALQIPQHFILFEFQLLPIT